MVAVAVGVAVVVEVVVEVGVMVEVEVGVGMILGFTGTRKGCTPPQLAALRSFLGLYRPGVLLHGGAVGADAEAHYLGLDAGWRIEVYPAYDNEVWLLGLMPWGVVYPARPPLDRNMIIAHRGERLVACPHEAEEQKHGGTWMTVRLARRQGRLVTLILPSGEIKEEHPK